MGNKSLPIGVFDSGIGGLTVAAEIRRALPNEQILYFGDAARCPYGDRPMHEVRTFALQIADFLQQLGIKILVVACNTATAAALPELTTHCNIPVVGVIEPGAKAAVRATKNGRIGVIGTVGTVGSGAYEEAVRRRAEIVDVFSLACPDFVPLVEQGTWDGPEAFRVVERALMPLQVTDIDTLILGCTHYPHLQNPIEKVMGSHVSLISSAEETAAEVVRVLGQRDELQNHSQPLHRDVFYTTGDGTKLRFALGKWMGMDPVEFSVETVQLSTLQMTRQ